MALKAGGPVDAPAGGIAADSLAPRRIGTLVYPIAARHVPISSPAKVRRIRDYRAELVVTGNRYADALTASEVWAEQPYPSRHSTSAKPAWALGLIGMEMEGQSADLDTLLISVGGGELIAGIVAWFGGNVTLSSISDSVHSLVGRSFALRCSLLLSICADVPSGPTPFGAGISIFDSGL
jgi:threonine dehydratase